MSQNETVTIWIERLKAGHSSAAHRLWERYVEKLVRLARRKLGRSPRRAVDEEDVVLSAFDAFLRGAEEGRFSQLDDRDDLWQLLVMLTERKAIGVRRYEQALRRGGGRVRGESVFAQEEDDGSQKPSLNQVPDREPTPAFAAEVAQQLDDLFGRLDDETQREVALGKLEGYTNKELAKRLNVSLRAVERKLHIIRRKWDREPEQ